VSHDIGGRPHLSVVVPAYNEARILPDSLQSIFEYLDRERLQSEVLVVDDGSADATARVAGEALRGRRGRVLGSPANRGKGSAVRLGVMEAVGRWVLMTDADLSAPMEEYAKLAAAARDHDLDVVIGSRGLPESRIEVRQKWPREWMGKTFNLLMRAMTGLRFRDTQCGFKLMDRKRVRPLFEKMTIDRFAFDVELLFLCQRFGLRVREVPIVWRNVADSRVSMIGDPLSMLWDIVRVRWRFRRGAYNPEERAAGGDPV